MEWAWYKEWAWYSEWAWDTQPQYYARGKLYLKRGNLDACRTTTVVLWLPLWYSSYHNSGYHFVIPVTAVLFRLPLCYSSYHCAIPVTTIPVTTMLFQLPLCYSNYHYSSYPSAIYEKAFFQNSQERWVFVEEFSSTHIFYHLQYILRSEVHEALASCTSNVNKRFFNTQFSFNT